MYFKFHVECFYGDTLSEKDATETENNIKLAIEATLTKLTLTDITIEGVANFGDIS